MDKADAPQMTSPVTPYLTIKGAAAALEFYKKAFGAKENSRMPTPDGKRLMHADMTINNGRILMSDEFPEHCDESGVAVLAPIAGQPHGVAIALHYATPAEVDAVYQRAVDAGCTSTMKPENMFWNARFAMLRDPFGHRWMLNAPLPASA